MNHETYQKKRSQKENRKIEYRIMSNKKSRRGVSQYKSRKNRSSKTRKMRNRRIHGGGACSDFSNLPIHHYYPINNYQSDVQGAQIASRLQPSVVYGGKQRRSVNISRKNRKQNQTQRQRQNLPHKNKMKGGNLVSSFNNTAQYTSGPFQMIQSLITNQGNISSGINGANILYGYPTENTNANQDLIPDYLV